MENQTKVLSMNINCCANCPRELKKKLLKMPGVETVAIDLEKNLVAVTGPLDATTLVNKVAKLGKRVQLLPTDARPKNNNNNNVEHKHKDTTKEGRSYNHNYKPPNRDNPTATQKGKSHQNCCCHDGHHGHNHDHDHDYKKEEEHKCEAYVPPVIDPKICRDYYCKTHQPVRTMVDRVPADSSNWFGGLPFYSNFGGVNPYGSSYGYPGWYGQEPPRFGYHGRGRMLRHPFGFH